MGSHEYEYHLLKIAELRDQLDSSSFREVGYVLERRDDGQIRLIKAVIVAL